MAALMSLPNELLVIIFENLDQESIDRTSKVNMRLRAVVNRYKLYKPLAREIKITRNTAFENDVKMITLTFKMSLLKKNDEFTGSIYVRNFSMQFRSNDSEENIGQQMVDLLNKIHGSRIVKLDLPTAGLGVPFEVLKSAFNKASVDLSLITQLDSCQTLQLSEIDDEHLARIMSMNPEKIFLKNCKTSISFEALSTQIEKITREDRIINWNFGFIAEEDLLPMVQVFPTIEAEFELIAVAADVFIHKIRRQLPKKEGCEVQYQEITFTAKINFPM